MVLPVRLTNTKKKRRGQHKKHDIRYFCCLRKNDGDGRMEFEGLSDLCEVVQRQKEEVSLAASGRGVRDAGEGKRKSTKHVTVSLKSYKYVDLKIFLPRSTPGI
ncbi:hypothetical protein AVEN_102767-1 [Araneus ventricosus]|uniref:Uncharacterized protein n=1 Tax=Araneus ventricosus TaxID=182803 RepID=A0A4Y2WL74_ARAVE|nr:hypothetical protein AVEN_102767-1 [Araneus ventricosus]